MKRTIPILFAAIALVAVLSNAADPAGKGESGSPAGASQKAAAKAYEAVIPKRELKFDVSEEESSAKLFLKSPEMVRLNYVATFTLAFEFPQPDSLPGFGGGMSDEAAILSNRFLVPTSFMKSLVEKVPEDRLPAKDIVSELTKRSNPHVRCTVSDLGRVVRRDGTIAPPDPTLRVDLQVLAPTAERARELARAIILLCDYGYSYDLHRSYPKRKKSKEQQLPQQEASLKECEAKLLGLEKALGELKGFEDISPKALTNFVTQQRLISVDLAGIAARIKACERLLADTKNLSASRIEQIETVKITAEIELVGVEARRRAIEEILDKGKRYLELSKEATHYRNAVRATKDWVARSKRAIGEYAAAFEQKKAFAQISPITIRRIEWTLENE